MKEQQFSYLFLYATISDRKLVIPNSVTTIYGGLRNPYTADALSTSDYYPFGSLMPGRNSNTTDYRYGFNGMEKEDEVTGVTGSHITTYFREYDLRLLRTWSLDPKRALMPWQSPYAFSENRVIDGIELEGAEYYSVHIQRSPDGSKPFSKSLIKIVSHRDTKKGYGSKAVKV